MAHFASASGHVCGQRIAVHFLGWRDPPLVRRLDCLYCGLTWRLGGERVASANGRLPALRCMGDDAAASRCRADATRLHAKTAEARRIQPDCCPKYRYIVSPVATKLSAVMIFAGEGSGYRKKSSPPSRQAHHHLRHRCGAGLVLREPVQPSSCTTAATVFAGRTGEGGTCSWWQPAWTAARRFEFCGERMTHTGEASAGSVVAFWNRGTA